MSTLSKLAILIIVFAVGFTMGQGKYPLDFDGNGKLTMNDFHVALQHLSEKK